MDSTAAALQASNDTLAALGMERRGWAVLSIEPAELPPIAPPRPGLSEAHHLAITFGRSDRSAEQFVVHFMTGDQDGWAVAEVATQIQDHTIEFLQGAALPECPGHVHPLSARVEAGLAIWACPRGSDYYSRPILCS